jgi:phosphoribosylformylglycinamidine synthase I
MDAGIGDRGRNEAKNETRLYVQLIPPHPMDSQRSTSIVNRYLKDVKVCILRVGGTNCDRETKRALEDLGVKAEVVHLARLLREGNLLEYQGLVIPGGFSYGDYVRAGAILGKQIAAKLGRELKAFIDDGRPVLGICNGFQVLVEAEILPGLKGFEGFQMAALTTNSSARYECRWVHLIHENRGKCLFTSNIPYRRVLRIPVGHAEGRFILLREKERECLDRLIEDDQIVFRYCRPDGKPAGGEYPFNPNGSIYDIAGICNPSGNVLGLMPHPERAYFGWQLPDWTSLGEPPAYGDGRLIFESFVDYMKRL